MKTAGLLFVGWLLGQLIHYDYNQTSDYRFLKSTDVAIIKKLEKSQDPVLSKLASTRLQLLIATK